LGFFDPGAEVINALAQGYPAALGNGLLETRARCALIAQVLPFACGASRSPARDEYTVTTLIENRWREEPGSGCDACKDQRKAHETL